MWVPPGAQEDTHHLITSLRPTRLTGAGVVFSPQPSPSPQPRAAVTTRALRVNHRNPRQGMTTQAPPGPGRQNPRFVNHRNPRQGMTT
jgi:hypothetical protein